MYGAEHKPEQAATGLVVLAASFGGLRAIQTVLGALPKAFPLPIVVILHRIAAPLDPLIEILARRCQLPVQAATDTAALVPGTITVLPAGQRGGLAADGTLRIGPTDGQRLSADAFMHDATQHYRAGVIGAILTGKLADGADGARAIKRAGGMVLVQDPLDCAAPGMPTAALATGCVDHQLPLAMIGPMLIALVMAPGAADLLRVPMSPWASPQAG